MKDGYVTAERVEKSEHEDDGKWFEGHGGGVTVEMEQIYSKGRCQKGGQLLELGLHPSASSRVYSAPDTQACLPGLHQLQTGC